MIPDFEPMGWTMALLVFGCKNFELYAGIWCISCLFGCWYRLIFGSIFGVLACVILGLPTFSAWADNPSIQTRHLMIGTLNSQACFV